MEKKRNDRMNRKKRWLICLSTTFGGISLALVQNKVSPILTTLMTIFKINASTAGWLSSVFALIGVFIALPASKIIQQFGAKKSGLASLVCAIIGSLIGVLSNNIVILMISRVIEGVGVGIISVLGPMMVTEWFEPSERGLPMSIWTAWMTISQAIIFFSATAITNLYTWRGVWWLGIILCIISAFLYLFFVEEPKQNVPTEKESFNDFFKSLFKVFISDGVKSTSTWIMALASFIFTICSFTFVSWISGIWVKNIDISLSQVTSMIGILYLVEIAYTVIIGFVLDKITHIKRMGAILAIFYAILGFIAFNCTKSLGLAWILIFIYPICDGGIPTVIYTLAPSTEKDNRYSPQAISIMNMGLNAGTLCAAPLSGAVMGINQKYVGVMFAALAICLSIFIMAIKLFDIKKSKKVSNI